MPNPPPTPAGVTDASRADRAEWVEANPLRAWRHAQAPKMSILETAERIGVGMSMVQMYERGVHKPGDKAAEGLARILGDGWSEDWDRWLADKPTT